MSHFNSCCCRGEEDEDEINEKRRAQLEKGPLEDRRCKDILWLIVFIAFNIVALVVAGLSLKYGEPLRLINGVDSFGNICGVDNTDNGLDKEATAAGKFADNFALDMTAHDYLYFQLSGADLKVCVSSCPTGNISSCSPANPCQNIGVCVSGTSPYTADGGDNCPDSVYASEAKFGLKYCVPTVADSTLDSFWSKLNDLGNLQEIFEDFAYSWKIIIYCCLIAFGLSLLLMLLLRCVAAPLVYGLLLAGIAGFVALDIFMWVTWKQIKDDRKENNDDSDSAKRNEKLAMGLMITALVLSLIFFIIVCALRKRIRLAVSIMEEASCAIARMPHLILSPIFTWLALALYLAFWVVVVVYLSSSDVYSVDTNTSNPVVADKDNRGYFVRAWWIQLFALLWITQFILASQEFVVASGIVTWYFTRDKATMLRPYGRSIYTLMRYHLGTIAAGSLIIAIIQLIRIILAYIDYKLHKNGDPGRIVSFLLRCLQCCLWCFEKCMKFLNKNAYIEVAIYGYSFCTAAKEAFKILLANAARVAVLNTVSAFVLFILKLVVVAGASIAAIAWLKDDEEVNFYYIVVVAVAIFAYLIADVFLDVYDLATDVILICFCEDSKRNNGKDKPYFMSDRLLKFMKRNATNELPPANDGDSKKDPPAYVKAPED